MLTGKERSGMAVRDRTGFVRSGMTRQSRRDTDGGGTQSFGLAVPDGKGSVSHGRIWYGLVRQSGFGVVVMG